MAQNLFVEVSYSMQICFPMVFEGTPEVLGEKKSNVQSKRMLKGPLILHMKEALRLNRTSALRRATGLLTGH